MTDFHKFDDVVTVVDTHRILVQDQAPPLPQKGEGMSIQQLLDFIAENLSEFSTAELSFKITFDTTGNLQIIGSGTGVLQINTASPQNSVQYFFDANGVDMSIRTLDDVFADISVVLTHNLVTEDTKIPDLVLNQIILVRRTTDPVNPPDGTTVRYLTDGTGAIGAAGDTIEKTTQGGVTRATIVSVFALGTIIP